MDVAYGATSALVGEIVGWMVSRGIDLYNTIDRPHIATTAQRHTSFVVVTGLSCKQGRQPTSLL